MDDERAEELKQRTVAQRREEAELLPESYEECFYRVDGMHCATCESFIEMMASHQDGTYKCEASYASEMIKLYYDPEELDAKDFKSSLAGMGYNIYDPDKKASQNTAANDEAVRLIIGAFLGIVGLVIYGLFLYPSYISDTNFIPVTESERLFFVSNVAVMTSIVLFYTGFPILRGAWVSLSVLKPNMDLLIAIAALSAYFYSIGAFITGSTEVYFDVTTAIILVVSVGNAYEKKMKAAKDDFLDRLSEQQPETARVKSDANWIEKSLSEIQPGNQIMVKAGERIPVDGEIVAGSGVVNEALMTGESKPINKNVGDQVLSGTTLTQNALTIEVGEEVKSTVDELMRLMWNIQSSHAGVQRLADRLAAWFVPVIIVVGLSTFAFHLMSGAAASSALLTALAVLIVSCPCALGLATPLAIASGIRNALKSNIIFKTASTFEKNADVDIVAFDKTGTLTSGSMELIDEGSNEKALKYAALLEQYASHPVAQTIATKSSSEVEVRDFQTHQQGISGNIDEQLVYVGKPEWIAKHSFELTTEQSSKIKESRAQGNIPVAVAWAGTVHSVLVVGDLLREEAQSIIRSLKQQDKQIAIITGDSKEAAESISEELDPDFLFTEAHPESKSNIIEQLQRFGSVAMVGDGTNDAPALAQADLGIAFGDLTAIAAESAQMVITKSNLGLVGTAFGIMKQTSRRIRQNIGWAFLYNITTIPLAAVGLINPLFAAVAMAASSIIVVGNSSRSMKVSSD